MGKLHTLRRAIERNPQAFTAVVSCPETNMFSPGKAILRARGVSRVAKRDWVPCYYGTYRPFVRKVLRELNDNGVAISDVGGETVEVR